MLGRIKVRAFTSHVLALLCIGLRSSFYHFRCWLSFCWRLLYGWWRLRIHGLRYRFRGVCRLVLRLVARRLSILSYMFWEMWELFLCTILRDQIFSFILSWWYSFEIFWAPACAWLYILMKFMLPISIFMSYQLVETVVCKWYQMFYYPLRLNV